MDRLRAERPDPAGAAGLAMEAIVPALTPKQADALRAIDFAAETKGLRQWFRALLRSEPPGEQINAFYFGIFDQVVGLLKNKDAPAMYVGGSNCFDPADEFGEWACDMAYLPRLRYPRVRAFRQLASVVPPEDDFRSIVADAFVFSLAQDLTTHTESSLVLGNHPWRAVGSGYDAGDAHLVGYITQAGFVTQHPDT